MTVSAAPRVLTVRYFAGAAAAAGTDGNRLELPDGLDVAGLRSVLADRHPRLAPVLEVASLLVDGVTATDPAAPLGAAERVDVLPPFAGG